MNEFKKWKKDYIEHLQPRAEMLVNAGELTQRRMEAAWLAGQAEEREAIIELAHDVADHNGWGWDGDCNIGNNIEKAIRARGEEK